MVNQPAQGVIGGQAIFRDNGSVGRPTPYEATEPLTDWGEGDDYNDGDQPITFNYLPYDQTRGFNTCLAVVNPATYQNPLKFVVLATDEKTGTIGMKNPDGSAIGKAFSLPVYGQASFCLRDTIPQLQGHRGSLIIMSYDSLKVGIIGLRFDPSGSFTTVFPMSPL